MSGLVGSLDLALSEGKLEVSLLGGGKPGHEAYEVHLEATGSGVTVVLASGDTRVGAVAAAVHMLLNLQRTVAALEHADDSEL